MSGLAKAKLIELDQSFENEKPDGQQVEVQFNPESLKVTFANELVQPDGGDQAAGNAGRQFVGAGTTKLALQLWFDVTPMEKDPIDDVRRLTQKVIYFMTPQPLDADPTKMAPPGVRFQWGSFLFDGMVEGLEETLEYFSPDGKPLRASISLSCSQQKILQARFKGDGRVPERRGQAPLKAARQGDSLQSLAARAGKTDWQAIAAANGLEDPLRIAAGQLLNLNTPVDVRGRVDFGGVSGSVNGGVGLSGASVGTGAAGGIGVGGGASLRTGSGPNAALGGSVGGSVSLG
jgi:hypothetical protein